MKISQLLYVSTVLVAALAVYVTAEEDKKKKLQIGVKKRIDPELCTIKSKKGDTLHMHYTVSLTCYYLLYYNLMEYIHTCLRLDFTI